MSKSKFIGSDPPYIDGERQATLKLSEVHRCRDGYSKCYFFTTVDGNRIVMFSTRKQKLFVGDRIRASFVIKRHQDYLGVKQNVASSFKVLEVLSSSSTGNVTAVDNVLAVRKLSSSSSGNITAVDDVSAVSKLLRRIISLF
jgi:hypothetical protein